MGKRNVTVTVDAEAYRRARIWAAERRTSVSSVVSFLLAHLPDSPVAQQASELAPRGRTRVVDNTSLPQSAGMAHLIRAIERLSGRMSTPTKK